MRHRNGTFEFGELFELLNKTDGETWWTFWIWTRYPAADIYTRLVRKMIDTDFTFKTHLHRGQVSWKLPFVQLIFQFTRPSLPWHFQVYSILHLISDPINTIASLLAVLECGQARTEQLRASCDDATRAYVEAMRERRNERARASDLSSSPSPESKDSIDCGVKAIRDEHRQSRQDTLTPDQLWKAVTLVVISYDECGDCGDVFDFFDLLLSKIKESPHSKESRKAIRTLLSTAASLASDRGTRFLPVIVAQSAFIVSFILAFAKTQNGPPDSHNWINVEAHSIAFSCVFIWVIPAVFFSSIIGASQTEHEIPRKLNDSRKKLLCLDCSISGLTFPKEIHLRSDETNSGVESDNEQEDEMTLCVPTRSSTQQESAKSSVIQPRFSTVQCLGVYARVESGGLYSWQPDLFDSHTLIRHRHSRPSINRRTKIWHITLAGSLVFCSVFVSTIISGRVPPEGFDCRHIAEIFLFLLWVASFWAGQFVSSRIRSKGHASIDPTSALEFQAAKSQGAGEDSNDESGSNTNILESDMSTNTKSLYKFMFVKDLLVTSAVVVVILVTQWGIFNRCVCWTLWGWTPLMLPQIKEVEEILMKRIQLEWPAVTYSAFALEAIVSLLVGWWYFAIFRVYLQRDDGKSNLFKIRGLERSFRFLEYLSVWFKRPRSVQAGRESP